MAKAKVILATTNLSVSEIAFKLGFGSPSHLVSYLKAEVFPYLGQLKLENWAYINEYKLYPYSSSDTYNIIK